jgi:16S rRNA (adenine1518-N6/adenine1519-N6)-dimethyltransferase
MNLVRQILAEYEIHPKKRLGQSFLQDMNMVRRIAALVDADRDDTIVEIGAGLGLLTEELAKKAGRIIAIEIDPRLTAVLKSRLAAHREVVVVEGDVLDYDFSALCPKRKIQVVGNIPYYISTPILFRLIEYRRIIESMVLMFQKELADRIRASPGGKAYGIPTVIAQRYLEVDMALTVPQDCFFPKPEVVSSVLRFRTRGEEARGVDDALFSFTVRSAFSHRRKTLWNNLRAAGIDGNLLEQVLNNTDIAASRRAETLTVGEFCLLAKELASVGWGKIH